MSINLGPNKQFKPKFVAIYEEFFNGGDPIKDNSQFWQELFLIRVNGPFLVSCFADQSDEDIRHLTTPLNLIFTKATATLKNGHPVRVYNALLTLSICFKCLFERKFYNFGNDVIHLVCGMDRRETFFKELIVSLADILGTAESDDMRITALNVLINIVSATDNINQNTLLEYFLLNDIFDTIIQTFVTSTCEKLRSGALFVMAVLANYQKYETANSYLIRLRSCSNERTMNFIISAVTRSLHTYNETYHLSFHKVTQEPSLFSRLFNMFSFTSSSSTTTTSSTPSPSPTPAPSLPPASPPQTSPNSHQVGSNGSDPPPSPQPLTPLGVISPPAVGALLLMFYELIQGNKLFSSTLTLWKEEGNNEGKKMIPPLLPEYLTFCANIFSEVESNITVAYAKLCLINLCLITEDSSINRLMHDYDLAISPLDVYRDITTKQSISPQLLRARPIWCYLIDLVIHFIKLNTKRDTFHPQLHILAMDLVHRILCYEVKASATESRLDYKWRELWIHLVLLFKFLSQSKRLENSEDNLILAHKVVNIVNMFITFGDKFLPVQSDYDDLYYELIRARADLQNFFLELEKYEKNTGRLSDYFNLRTILAHFNQKIENWVRLNPTVTLSTEIVLEIIKNNYDTLKLKLQENLDKYEAFVENPNNVPFFRQLLRMIVTTTKNKDSVV